MPTRLTLRRLAAIEEALHARMAGERDNAGDPEAPADDDYKGALDWVGDEITRREKRTGRRA